MRLPDLVKELPYQLEEFDIWVTPSLGDIADSQKYREELALVVSAFETIGAATADFESVERCTPEAIATVMAEVISTLGVAERKAILLAFASTLFAVTGTSDNNFKCQFPLFLRDQSLWLYVPKPRKKRGRVEVAQVPIPRVLRSDTYMSWIALIGDSAVEARLLQEFIAFLLRDERSVNQFWAIGYAYFALKLFGKSADLLAPIVIFKVRGSVMASGGHAPEESLRLIMDDWGLRRGIDYNTNDVVVVADNEVREDTKTRAYDFVLPFTTPGWTLGWDQRIYIQCQFYAGDSGSVSHKNVDQTRGSRDSIRGFVNSPRFVEYVDGAGYFSSLNSDLRRLLSYPDTDSFIQIRSAPIRLRKMLQGIGFLTPIEVALYVALGASSVDHLWQSAAADGYTEGEFRRALDVSIEAGFLLEDEQRLAIVSARGEVVRRYLLLDLVALNGRALRRDELAGRILIPGYGAFFGMAVQELARIAIRRSPLFANDFCQTTSFLSDIEWLVEKGYAMSR